MSQILDATQTWLVPHEIVFSVSRFEPAGAQLELVFGGSVTRFKFFKFGLRKTKFFNLSYVAELPSAGSMELSFCHKLKFSKPYVFANQCRRPLIFQTLNFVRSKNLSLKYQRTTPSVCNDIGIGKFEFLAKTQFLWGMGGLPPPINGLCLRYNNSRKLEWCINFIMGITLKKLVYKILFFSVFYITFIKSINREYFLNCFLKTNFLKVYIKNNKKLL